MGSVHPLAAADSDTTLGRAVDAYLATLSGSEQASTRRTYGRVLRWIVTEFGNDAARDIDAERFAGWFGARWGDRTPSTWNVCLDAIRSAAAYWQRQGWITADPSRMLVRRKPRPDQVRALSRADVEQLLTRADIGLRERTLWRMLWRMLYETAARSAEVLGLDVGDLDLPNRCARVRRKGGAIDIIVWQTGTARLLPRLLKGRKSGPVFVTERKARVPLPAADLDPSGRARLSYQQAAALFSGASGGATLHQLRHSALTHDAELGTGTPMLMARSGHTSVRSLAKYARVSAEALQRHQAERDPARRRQQARPPPTPA
jgi:integrase/recombinase XerC/integrase/recombinase XerD